MNYINEDKNYKTQEEWIKYLEESIRELRKEKENLNKENGRLKAENRELKETNMDLNSALMVSSAEIVRLKEFKERREESMFYFKAQMERAEPKTAKEAEDLQKAKELFEKLYREEIHYLEEENKQLKEKLEKWEKDYKEWIIVHCRNG